MTSAIRFSLSAAVLLTLPAWATEPGTGNPDGHCAVPPAAAAESISKPDHVIGTGTPASCTSKAFVSAVAQGGVITFNCGPKAITLKLSETAKVFNDKPNVVIDGGGLVTLSGNGKVRILYQNTCDPQQHWTTDHCDTQDLPHLTVQNITLVKGNSTGQDYGQSNVYGGGAIFVRGGRFKVVNARFFKNVCEPTGPDLGGAAVRVLGPSPLSPVYVTHSTFGGGAKYRNQCSNGGAISGLTASFSLYNTLITDNKAIGYGGNPARSGTPGGGSGGGIYQDGTTMDLSMCGTKMQDNHANEGGGAVFYTSNDRTGTMSITDSALIHNVNDGFETAGLPGIFILAKPGQPVITNSVLTP